VAGLGMGSHALTRLACADSAVAVRTI
jgi:hypothetical protein